MAIYPSSDCLTMMRCNSLIFVFLQRTHPLEARISKPGILLSLLGRFYFFAKPDQNCAVILVFFSFSFCIPLELVHPFLVK